MSTDAFDRFRSFGSVKSLDGDGSARKNDEKTSEIGWREEEGEEGEEEKEEKEEKKNRSRREREGERPTRVSTLITSKSTKSVRPALALFRPFSLVSDL